MTLTSNYKKHKSLHPGKRILIPNFNKTLISMLLPLKISSVLDAGCGEGITLRMLKDEKIGKKFLGIDSSEKALKIGKNNNKDLTLKKGNIYKIDQKNSSFDLVVCTEVLEHLGKPEKALRELFRVSKKYIVLSVPNEPWFRVLEMLGGKNWKRWGNDPEHINHWGSKEFKKFVESYKWRIVSIKTPPPWTIILLEK